MFWYGDTFLISQNFALKLIKFIVIFKCLSINGFIALLILGHVYYYLLIS